VFKGILVLGEGDLNVLDAIDPELNLRRSGAGATGGATAFEMTDPLPIEDIEPFLCMRFVIICPIGSGVVV